MVAGTKVATLDGEAFAALRTAALQDGAASPRAHALAEAVHLFSPAIVGLERALHGNNLGKWERITLRM